MYERFFGLACRPFALRPDPRFLYLGDRHATALQLLEYGLFEQDGFVVVSGEVGSGKTILIRHLLNALVDKYQIGLISNTHGSFGGLLYWVASAFDIPTEGRSEAALYDAFVQHLVDGYANGQRTLIIVDEAQNLSKKSLEEIRVLSNINADGNHIVQLLLVGQPELRQLLRQPGLEQFAQRISTHFHLRSLDEVDVSRYVNHRLTVAGAVRPIFTNTALDYLADASCGIPRLINQIADSALVYAFADQSRIVDSRIMLQVLNDRLLSQVLPVNPSIDERLPIGFGDR